MLDEKRFAVLIDADNISAKYIKYIFDEIANYGIATYKRIYGDWTKPATGSWKDVLLEHSITPVQQYGYTVGKNATDSAMIIDAMDILYSKNVEGFCIVSSDSDFTKLSSRLRESGMIVVGMGEQKTPKPFIASCNQFKYLDVLAESEEKVNELDTTTTSSDTDESAKNMTDINLIKATILKMMNEIDENEQRMNMGELGSRLLKRYPDFDVRNYGYNKLSKFLKNFDFLEIKTSGKEGTSLWVSLKVTPLKTASNTAVQKKPQKSTKRNGT